MNPRVIVLAPLERFSLRNAQVYGEIQYLFTDAHDCNPMHGQGALVKIAQKLAEVRYDVERDHVALTGPVASVALLLLAASEFSEHGNVRVLMFDARGQGEYRSKSISPQDAAV